MTAWTCCEEPLLFAVFLLTGATWLITWAFRTAELPWAIRMVFWACLTVYVFRGYALRVLEVDRGWGTNLTVVALIFGLLLVMAATIRNSGLWGRRNVPPDQVP